MSGENPAMDISEQSQMPPISRDLARNSQADCAKYHSVRQATLV